MDRDLARGAEAPGREHDRAGPRAESGCGRIGKLVRHADLDLLLVADGRPKLDGDDVHAVGTGDRCAKGTGRVPRGDSRRAVLDGKLQVVEDAELPCRIRSRVLEGGNHTDVDAARVGVEGVRGAGRERVGRRAGRQRQREQRQQCGQDRDGRRSRRASSAPTEEPCEGPGPRARGHRRRPGRHDGLDLCPVCIEQGSGSGAAAPR